MTNAMLFALFGGMALLLYGMQLAGDGLQHAAGGRMRQILSGLTHNRFKALLVGAFITAVIQSSSATSVMLVGFASAGLLDLTQTIGVILGADIGTTLTVQLIAFQVLDYALLLVGLGFALIFFAKRRIFKYLGQAGLGFGFIFFAMQVMGQAMAPLRDSPLFADMITALGDSPLLGIVVSAAFTALVHSSAATIGLGLTLAVQGLLPLASAVPVIFGANIGTCATALASSLGTTAEARRVALAHTLFKVLGVLVFLPFTAPFAQVVALTADDPSRQIANAHTLFNVGITILFLPFAGPMARLVKSLVAEDREADSPLKARYLDEHILDTPALALGQATREALRMADVVSDMFKRSLEAFGGDDQELVEFIEKQDDQVDALNREIKHYLTKLSQQSLTDEQARREMALLALINDLENIGDIVDRNLMDLARKRMYKGANFSEQGGRETRELHRAVAQNLERAISAFATGDRALAHKVLEAKSEIRQMERHFRQNHIQRLHDGLPESIETSEIHLDILTNLKRINSHITSIAYPILEGP
jgi:phosphate:Na+ symporter